MYTLFAALILFMVFCVLFLADAIWGIQARAHDGSEKLLRLETYAAKAHGELLRTEVDNAISERANYATTLLEYSQAITDFNDVLEHPDWATRKLFTDKDSERSLRKFQSQSLQMIQSISLIMQAEKERDILKSKRKLALQFHDGFFEDAERILDKKLIQISTLHRIIDIFNWLIIPVLTVILMVIWKYMISPMIKSQKRNLNDLRISQRSALQMADTSVQANNAKTQFLTVLSHELRTPLNGVIALSEELVAQTMQTNAHTTAQQVLTKGHELAILVDEVITLTESNSNGLFDIDDLMNKVHIKQAKLGKQDQEALAFKIPTECKILIADDNRTNRLVLNKLVNRMGGQADIVKDGEEAVQAFKTSPYDLLLLDIAMPNKTGEQAIQEIRIHEKSKK